MQNSHFKVSLFSFACRFSLAALYTLPNASQCSVLKRRHVSQPTQTPVVPVGNPSCCSSIANVSSSTLYLQPLLMMKSMPAIAPLTSPDVRFDFDTKSSTFLNCTKRVSRQTAPVDDDLTSIVSPRHPLTTRYGSRSKSSINTVHC
jgi:hypothetical protein